MRNPTCRRLFIVCAAILPAILAGVTECGGAPKTVRVLMVGNSYTRGISHAFNKLAGVGKTRIAVEYITPGGKTLLWHANSEKTVSAIRSGNWDVVVLQEQSQTPAYPNTRPKFLEGCRKLSKLIAASGGRTVLFQTWGRRDGDKLNPHAAPDYVTMQNLLSAGYGEAAAAVKADAAPAGEAWGHVRKTDPELFARLYRKDGSHPSATGGYLAACVLYTVIVGQSPPADATADGVAPDDAAKLREIARVAVPSK